MDKKIPTELMFLTPICILCSLYNENFVINFINFIYITAECKCKLIKNITLRKFIEKYMNTIPQKINFGCKFHGFKKYIFYCKDCKINLCEDCLRVKAKYNNVIGKHTLHETHTKITLSKNKKQINNIDKTLKILSETKYKNNSIINLISNLNKNYSQFMSYNAYKTLQNAEKFLINMNQILPEANEKLEYEELIKINTIEELKKNINNSNLIYKIIIDGDKTKETMEDLSIFKRKDFNELKVLFLNSIKLKNISDLSTCNLPKLKRFDIECNLVNDDSLNAFEHINAKIINLFDNKFTSPRIFEIIKKNKNLKDFYIGKNPLIFNDVDNNIKYDLPINIEIFGITNVFNKLTNKFMLNIGIENIKILYLTSNGFTSFKIFENIKFNRLEKFWARGNPEKGYIEDINEIKYLNDKTTIQIIILKENKIKNIEELVKIIPDFPNLKYINIEDNGITKRRCKKVLKEIKSIKGYEKFELKYH